MDNKFLEEIMDIIDREVPEELRSLFAFTVKDSNELILIKFDFWGRYFFPSYFKSEDAPFHNELNGYNLDIYKGIVADQFVDIAFRGAGKDIKTELFITFCITNDIDNFRKYFKILAEDGDNSIATVTGIYNRLVNAKMVRVYGDLFEKTVYKREERKDVFTTTKGVKVEADIVGSGQRGKKQDEVRPDFLWFNDFENRKTLRSAVITRAIWDNMEEARTGLEVGGGCVYTCNYVSENGNVHRLVTEKLNDRKIVFIKPIIENGKSTWPERYSLEMIEAFKKSDDDFEGERMCQPNASKDIYFDRATLDEMKILEPIREIGRFKIYKEYNPGHAYAGGADVAGGVGLDSSASVFIDFSTFPAQVVGVFHDNTISPESFGDELYSEANRFGGCLIVPENNKFDQCILKLKILGAKLYMMAARAIKAGFSTATTYGWNTNALTKSQMLGSLRDAIVDGLIDLNDADLIADCKGFTRNDFLDNPVDIRLTTRHFDLVTALAIAWQMKDHTQPKESAKRKEYKVRTEESSTNMAI